MDKLHNPFKHALKSGKLQLGLWHSLSSPIVAEILAEAGFDWILLDTEHAPNELPMVLGELQAMSSGTAHPVVRPAWNDPVIIKRLLDIGAQSLLIPYVETEEEARRAVMSVRYPPDGFRGFAGQARASRYGRIKGYHAAANAEICLLLQVETKRGSRGATSPISAMRSTLASSSGSSSAPAKAPFSSFQARLMISLRNAFALRDQ